MLQLASYTHELDSCPLDQEKCCDRQCERTVQIRRYRTESKQSQQIRKQHEEKYRCHVWCKDRSELNAHDRLYHAVRFFYHEFCNHLLAFRNPLQLAG